MARRKQARLIDVKDIRSILRLTHEQGLSVRGISERLEISKTTDSTYLLQAAPEWLWKQTVFVSVHRKRQALTE